VGSLSSGSAERRARLDNTIFSATRPPIAPSFASAYAGLPGVSGWSCVHRSEVWLKAAQHLRAGSLRARSTAPCVPPAGQPTPSQQIGPAGALPARPSPPTQVLANQRVRTRRHEQLPALSTWARLMLHPPRQVVARVAFPPRPNRRIVALAAPRRQPVPRLQIRRKSAQRTRFTAPRAPFPVRFSHHSGAPAA
jgi:hypothetical protein